jgi:hypothetical protein
MAGGLEEAKAVMFCLGQQKKVCVSIYGQKKCQLMK